MSHAKIVGAYTSAEAIHKEFITSHRAPDLDHLTQSLDDVEVSTKVNPKGHIVNITAILQ